MNICRTAVCNKGFLKNPSFTIACLPQTYFQPQFSCTHLPVLFFAVAEVSPGSFLVPKMADPPSARKDEFPFPDSTAGSHVSDRFYLHTRLHDTFHIADSTLLSALANPDSRCSFPTTACVPLQSHPPGSPTALHQTHTYPAPCLGQSAAHGVLQCSRSCLQVNVFNVNCFSPDF